MSWMSVHPVVEDEVAAEAVLSQATGMKKQLGVPIQNCWKLHLLVVQKPGVIHHLD